jgi:flavin-dependent dehydrogenase
MTLPPHPTADLVPIAAAHPPARCDVLVVGAGPAGSACAQTLAQAGLVVVLVDQHEFPRDKICGDGLIPDAHAALQRLGVLDQVLAHARSVSHVACIAPRGGRVAVPGRLAVLPRRQLDHLLVQSACRAGVHLATPWRFEAALESLDGRVIGARLVRSQRHGSTAQAVEVDKAEAQAQAEAQTVEVQARWVVLATGAAMPAMLAAGLCERRAPSGVALRGYVHAPALRGRIEQMEIVWHRSLRPGYGWIFPCGGDVYNIGVGAFHGAKAAANGRQRAGVDANLRQLLEAFGACHAPAGELLAQGRWLDDGGPKGAPLRCTLQGARLGRPGLLATGEAIGSTYDFTGEGIGKALETGLMAGELIAQALLRDPDAAADDDEVAVLAPYAQRIASLRPRFGLYARANQVNAHPWLADLVIWRAQRSARLRQRMAGVLEERTNPGHLLSLRGLYKLLFQ